MTKNGFGTDLWKNLQAVKLSKDGGLDAPVRADGTHGIVVGVDAIADSDAVGGGSAASPVPTPRWWKRLLRRR